MSALLAHSSSSSCSSCCARGVHARKHQAQAHQHQHSRWWAAPPTSPQESSSSGVSSSGRWGSRVGCRAGFGNNSTEEKQQQQQPQTPTRELDAAEALEARIRNRRARKENRPRVEVNSPIVDAVSGKSPMTPEAQAETSLVTGMLFLFYAIIIEGLVIASSGFLPEDWDDFIQHSLYPNYTPTVLLFLGLSSAYGLWKTGKISLPGLGAPPPPEQGSK